MITQINIYDGNVGQTNRSLACTHHKLSVVLPAAQPIPSWRTMSSNWQVRRLNSWLQIGWKLIHNLWIVDDIHSGWHEAELVAVCVSSDAVLAQNCNSWTRDLKMVGDNGGVA